MSGLPPPSAVSSIWPRDFAGPTTDIFPMMGPIPNSDSVTLPMINNSNLPLNTTNLPPTISQPVRTPFPSLQPPFGPSNSFIPNNISVAPALPTFTPYIPNVAQNIQNVANDRRINQLEDENVRRRNTTATIQQLGTQVLQGQMDVQEQVLQYQFMLDQCMETLDHQNSVLTEQAEELAVLRAKMRHFEYFIDTIKHNKTKHPLRSTSGDINFMNNNLSCVRNPLSSYLQPKSPFFTGGITRTTSSKFQPINPRYRPPNDQFRSTTPSFPNNPPIAQPIANF